MHVTHSNNVPRLLEKATTKTKLISFLVFSYSFRRTARMLRLTGAGMPHTCQNAAMPKSFPALCIVAVFRILLGRDSCWL